MTNSSSKAKQVRVYPWVLGLLLISFILVSLFGGVSDYLIYKRIVNPNLELNAISIKHFTKENLLRKYNKVTAKGLDSNSDIPSFWLYVDESDLQSLNSELPASGKQQYVSGHIKSNFTGLESEVDVKYRGGLPLHWLYEKKSLRVKLPDYVAVKGDKRFDLVNIPTPAVITDLLSYQFSKSMGLITPNYFPARVYINNKYKGLHFYLGGVDESILRKNRRMPGSIYSGDTLSYRDPFGGASKGMGELVFYRSDKKFTPLLWTEPRLWEKDSSRNAEQKNDRSDIDRFIGISNLSDKLSFMQEFERYFDKNKFYRYWALDSLTGTYHHDMFHNHKVYVDPYKGKFEPIAWDVRFWSTLAMAKDSVDYALLRQIQLNPFFEFERDKVAYELLKQFSVEETLDLIDDTFKRVLPELESDPLRQAVYHLDWIDGDKALPLEVNDTIEQIELLKSIFKRRHEFLSKVYENTEINMTNTKVSEKELLLTFSVNGNTPVTINFSKMFPSLESSSVVVEKIYESTSARQEFENDITLYPGRKIVKGNIFEREGKFLGYFGHDHVEPSPLVYKFKLVFRSPKASIQSSNLIGRNAITNSQVPINVKDKLEQENETVSLHPWLAQLNESKPERIVFSGEVKVDNTLRFSAKQSILIEKGTVFKVAKGKSLIFFGKVIAKGTFDSPIIIEPQNTNEPWGSVVIQGQQAGGSILEYIKVNGGTVVTEGLVNYPGQLNIHDVPEFTLNECEVNNNSVGDDSLHIAYSRGVIENCRFNEAKFDAVDIDISSVSLRNLVFTNVGNDAIDMMTSEISIENIKVNDAGDKCLSVGEESYVSVKDSKLANCQIGVAIKDLSEAKLDNVVFEGFRDSAIDLYQKNPRYGAGGTVQGSKLHGVHIENIRVGNKSKNLIKASELRPIM